MFLALLTPVKYLGIGSVEEVTRYFEPQKKSESVLQWIRTSQRTHCASIRKTGNCYV